MSISKSIQYGNIEISIDAITSLAGGVVTECCGVAGTASQKFPENGIAELLKKENYAEDVTVRQREGHLELDLYIVVSHEVRTSEIVYEVQQCVKYTLKKSLELELEKVNVYVQDVKIMKQGTAHGDN